MVVVDLPQRVGLRLGAAIHPTALGSGSIGTLANYRPDVRVPAEGRHRRLPSSRRRLQSLYRLRTQIAMRPALQLPAAHLSRSGQEPSGPVSDHGRLPLPDQLRLSRRGRQNTIKVESTPIQDSPSRHPSSVNVDPLTWCAHKLPVISCRPSLCKWEKKTMNILRKYWNWVCWTRSQTLAVYHSDLMYWLIVFQDRHWQNHLLLCNKWEPNSSQVDREHWHVHPHTHNGNSIWENDCENHDKVDFEKNNNNKSKGKKKLRKMWLERVCAGHFCPAVNFVALTIIKSCTVHVLYIYKYMIKYMMATTEKRSFLWYIESIT